jgi:hypothetical protein
MSQNKSKKKQKAIVDNKKQRIKRGKTRSLNESNVSMQRTFFFNDSAGRKFVFNIVLVSLLLLFVFAPLVVVLRRLSLIDIAMADNFGAIGSRFGYWLVELAGIASLGCGIGVISGIVKLRKSRLFNASKFFLETLRIVSISLVCMTVGWLLKGRVGGGIVGETVGLVLLKLFGQTGSLFFMCVAVLSLVPVEGFVFIQRMALQMTGLIIMSFLMFSRVILGFSYVVGRWLFECCSFLIVKLFSRLGFRRQETALVPELGTNVNRDLKSLRNSKLLTISPKEPTLSENTLPAIRAPVIVVNDMVDSGISDREFVVRDDDYVSPKIDLLQEADRNNSVLKPNDYADLSATIERKLKDFQIDGRVTHVHPGPVITLFEFEPAPGVKVGRIASLCDDLAMSLKASSIRILAPIPGQGTVGIEVPNKVRNIVRIREILESAEFLDEDSVLTVPLGRDTNGVPVVADIARMPHLLIAGATGTGKSVCINSLLIGLLYRASPAEVGLILIDPKILELSIYSDIPHLRVPVVTVAKQARAVLQWAVGEMERRYRLMQKLAVRSIDAYNEAVLSGNGVTTKKEGVGGDPLFPLQKIVIVIDELADLMLQVGRDIEELITRLAQKARAAGIHLIVATQRPSVDVITGLIKANFPARLSFRVASRVDSRTILDQMGAERLLGKGDMLFMAPGAQAIKRIHGAFVTDEEVSAVTEYIKAYAEPQYDQDIIAACEKALEEDSNTKGSYLEVQEYDALYDEAVKLVLQKGSASTSMIQRFFRIGYNRAARLIELMEREGVVGPMDGARPREVLLVPDSVTD